MEDQRPAPSSPEIAWRGPQKPAEGPSRMPPGPPEMPFCAALEVDP